MLELSRFYGIVVQMYYKGCDHNPPHVHAKYGDSVAEIDISSGEIMEGKLPQNASLLIKQWVLQHREELCEVWNSQIFKKIKPLE